MTAVILLIPPLPPHHTADITVLIHTPLLRIPPRRRDCTAVGAEVMKSTIQLLITITPCMVSIRPNNILPAAHHLTTWQPIGKPLRPPHIDAHHHRPSPPRRRHTANGMAVVAGAVDSI